MTSFADDTVFFMFVDRRARGVLAGVFLLLLALFGVLLGWLVTAQRRLGSAEPEAPVHGWSWAQVIKVLQWLGWRQRNALVDAAVRCVQLDKQLRPLFGVPLVSQHHQALVAANANNDANASATAIATPDVLSFLLAAWLTLAVAAVGAPLLVPLARSHVTSLVCCIKVRMRTLDVVSTALGVLALCGVGVLVADARSYAIECALVHEYVSDRIVAPLGIVAVRQAIVWSMPPSTARRSPTAVALLGAALSLVLATEYRHRLTTTGAVFSTALMIAGAPTLVAAGMRTLMALVSRGRCWRFALALLMATQLIIVADDVRCALLEPDAVHSFVVVCCTLHAAAFVVVSLVEVINARAVAVSASARSADNALCECGAHVRLGGAAERASPLERLAAGHTALIAEIGSVREHDCVAELERAVVNANVSLCDWPRRATIIGVLGDVDALTQLLLLDSRHGSSGAIAEPFRALVTTADRSKTLRLSGSGAVRALVHDELREATSYGALHFLMRDFVAASASALLVVIDWSKATHASVVEWLTERARPLSPDVVVLHVGSAPRSIVTAGQRVIHFAAEDLHRALRKVREIADHVAAASSMVAATTASPRVRLRLYAHCHRGDVLLLALAHTSPIRHRCNVCATRASRCTVRYARYVPCDVSVMRGDGVVECTVQTWDWQETVVTGRFLAAECALWLGVRGFGSRRTGAVGVGMCDVSVPGVRDVEEAAQVLTSILVTVDARARRCVLRLKVREELA